MDMSISPPPPASVSAATAHRTHPCLRGDPLPSSVLLPNLSTEIYYFRQEVDRLVSDYPYDISLSPGKKSRNGTALCHIPFYQISGHGPPPADLTGSSAGDVYVDIRTPGEYALYGNVGDGAWKRWYDPQPWRADKNDVQHPHFPGRTLWCGTSGISWFTPGTVRNSQEKARSQKLVSQNVHKDEATRWREASVLIALALARERKVKGRNLAAQSESASADILRSASCSPPFDSRDPTPAPVLGKRKARAARQEDRAADRCDVNLLNAKRCELLAASNQRLTEENEALAANISFLEKQLTDHSTGVKGPGSKQFCEWVDKVVKDGLKAQNIAVGKQLGVNGRIYLDLTTELTALETQLAEEESRKENAQLALDRAIAEDEECIKRFGVVTSQLGRSFGWA
ncbi:hypothetical protein C8R43DRAFT_1165186 [Mycena crocata]|nr:hypothetical protein C8R43DRAFT_1165186 [Mycena crocata]